MKRCVVFAGKTHHSLQRSTEDEGHELYLSDDRQSD